MTRSLATLLAPLALLATVAAGQTHPDPHATTRPAPRTQPAEPTPIGPGTELAVMAEAARAAAARYGIDAGVEIEIENGTLTVAHRVREYMVYPKDEEGRWGAELVPVIGPAHDGLIITVTAHPGEYDGAQRRLESRHDSVMLGAAIRGPYFTTYPTKTTLDRVGRHLRVDVVMGTGTDVMASRGVHNAMLRACADNGWLSDLMDARPVQPRRR